jgi:hypothetical protein
MRVKTKADVAGGLVYAVMSLVVAVLVCVGWAAYHDLPVYPASRAPACPANGACCHASAHPLPTMEKEK